MPLHSTRSFMFACGCFLFIYKTIYAEMQKEIYFWTSDYFRVFSRMCFVSFAQIHPFQRPYSGRRMINQFQDQNMLHKVVCFRHLFLVVIIKLLGYEQLEEKGKCLLEKGHEQMYIVYWAQMCSNIYICNNVYIYIHTSQYFNVFQSFCGFVWLKRVFVFVSIGGFLQRWFLRVSLRWPMGFGSPFAYLEPLPPERRNWSIAS